MVPLIGLIVFLGVYPKPVLERIQPSVDGCLVHVEEVGRRASTRPTPARARPGGREESGAEAVDGSAQVRDGAAGRRPIGSCRGRSPPASPPPDRWRAAASSSCWSAASSLLTIARLRASGTSRVVRTGGGRRPCDAAVRQAGHALARHAAPWAPSVTGRGRRDRRLRGVRHRGHLRHRGARGAAGRRLPAPRGAQRPRVLRPAADRRVGCVVMAMANDFIVLFLGLETLSIAVYVLSAMHLRRAQSQEPASSTSCSAAFSSAFLLYGIALIYGATGSTNFIRIHDFLAGHRAARTTCLHARRPGPPAGRPRLQGRGGAVPLVEPRRVRRRPHPVGGVHGRAVKAAAFAGADPRVRADLPELPSPTGGRSS